jgi:hypothetical protein
LDLALLLIQLVFKHRISRKMLLERMEQQLDLNSKCTTVKLVATKKTIEFRLCKLQVDFTVQESWVHKFHAPSRTTAAIFNALRMPPPVARDLAALAVDCLKSAAVAWNRKTSVGRKLKGVHWLLLIIAWLRADANYIQILEDAPALALAHHVDRLQRQCVRCNEIVARSVARPPGYTVNPQPGGAAQQLAVPLGLRVGRAARAAVGALIYMNAGLCHSC